MTPHIKICTPCYCDAIYEQSAAKRSIDLIKTLKNLPFTFEVCESPLRFGSRPLTLKRNWLINEGKSVLLLSHTNVATDRAFAKFLSRFNQETLSSKEMVGKFLRIGKIETPEIVKYKKYVDPMEAIRIKQEPLITEMSKIRLSIEDLEIS